MPRTQTLAHAVRDDVIADGYAGKIRLLIALSIDGSVLGVREWKVRKDGGRFDSVAGATVTPRAVIKAIRNAALYVADNREQLFAPN